MHTACQDDGGGGRVGVESIGWNLFNYRIEAGGDKEEEPKTRQKTRQARGQFSTQLVA